MIKKAEEEQHLGNRSHDASQIMFEKLQNKSTEREAEMNSTAEAPVPPSQTSDAQTVIMPTDAKKRAAGSTTKEPPQKMLKMSVDEMEVEGAPIGFKTVQGSMDMDCCGDTVRTHELMAGRKTNASDLSPTSPMHMEHEVWYTKMEVTVQIAWVFITWGVHCTKHVRVYVSAQKGY